jgi:hypothetical protein
MRTYSFWLTLSLWLLALAAAPLSASAESVWTYHDNTLRTGWDDAEKTLTAANVGGGTFGLQATTTVDSQVDAQPLVIPNQTISGQGTHTVVYVATGNDTLYAIDGVTGTILLSRNFGTPVPRSALPGGCDNNGETIGITSTPVIDTTTDTMYLIVDTYENNSAVYRVHAVSLSTLKDKVTPVVVTASATLTDGTSYVFNANVSRQRPALLLSGGKLYAGFGSYCDQAASTTRGWLLGWKAATLTPLAHNQLQNSVPTYKSKFFINSIWMSGYGPATASANSAIYFVTSNSDENTYGSSNIDESVMKVSSNLSAPKDFYTDPNQVYLDEHDEDLGSGGAMLAPDQPGETPQLLFAAGKAGTMYMFDRSGSAGLSLLNSYSIGRCFCGPSYFTGSDGVGRLVTSGASNVIEWKINTSSTAAASLTQQFSTGITSGQEGGFFTSISSDGTMAGTAVIWAVGRPSSIPGKMLLYAIDPDTGNVIYNASAGFWNYGSADANTVPTVANGHVYVATYQELAIFGLGAPAASANQDIFAALARKATAPAGFELESDQHAVWGTIAALTADEMVIKTRTGALVRVDLTAARQAGNVVGAGIGDAAVVLGRFVAGGVLDASNVEHAKPEPSLWPKDQ